MHRRRRLPSSMKVSSVTIFLFRAKSPGLNCPISNPQHVRTPLRRSSQIILPRRCCEQPLLPRTSPDTLGISLGATLRIAETEFDCASILDGSFPRVSCRQILGYFYAHRYRERKSERRIGKMLTSPIFRCKKFIRREFAYIGYSF